VIYEDLIIAGFGGQGVIFSGKLLARAGLRNGLEVTYFPSYGAEMRGGTANCTVIVSDHMIPSPIATNPAHVIIMSQPAWEKFLPRVKDRGDVLINSSLVRPTSTHNHVRVVKVPANEIAESLGEPRVANMVAMGAWATMTSVVPVPALLQSLEDMLTGPKVRLLTLNQEALREGARCVHRAR